MSQIHPRTIKLVLIEGASGVGKSSIRGQYISGRFSTGYRATIGADFITKTLPNESHPGESITLQIWDTAGQERFSSLSSAFFRGADACALMYDVNDPATLESLTKWWNEFKERAPLADEDANQFCCVVVGNKVDISTGKPSTRETMRFLETLIPPDTPPRPSSPFPPPSLDTERTGTRSIEISSSFPSQRRLAKSRSRSSTRFYGGTMTTTQTTMTIYHTPSSSFYDVLDVFESARTSPVPSSNWSVSSPRRRQTSLSSMSSSGLTITPSLFASGHNTAATTPPTPRPAPPDEGPRLFLTSAKTGEGVSEVFEYIAKRVVARWEYEEHTQDRILHMQEASGGDGRGRGADTIRLGLGQDSSRKSSQSKNSSARCC